MHAILASFGTDGDIFPYLGLARILVEHGHRVSLVLPAAFERLAKSAGAEFYPLISNVESEQLLSNPDFWHPLKGGFVAARWGRPLIRRQLDLLTKVVNAEPAVLVANLGLLAARIARDSLKVPLASVVLQPGIIASHVAPPILPAGPRLQPSAPRVIKSAYWWSIDLLGHFLTGHAANQIQKELGLPPIGRLFRWWMSPDLALGMFPEWYSGRPADWPKQLTLIDFPLHDGRSLTTLPDEANRFLDAGSPPVAFTPGSEVRNSKLFFERAVDVCEKLGCRGLFLAKHQEAIPRALPKSIMHFEYLPFQVVLPRCSAIVHHGGIGTIAKGLKAGIPHVTCPMGWDQFDNAERLVRLGVGTTAKRHGLKMYSLTRALKSALTPQLKSRAMEVAAKFGTDDANSRAVTLIESLFDRSYGTAPATQLSGRGDSMP
jgi:UDP:flavonoid glycosyltransferase YjiC (YdhE family)